MSNFALRTLRAFACVFVLLSFLFEAVAPASAAGSSTIAGVVADAQTGLPLSNVTVELRGTKTSVLTDTRGGFVLSGLAGGRYVLRIHTAGYVPSDTDTITVPDGGTAQVTLSLDRTSVASSEALKTIGQTSVSASQSLQKSTTMYRTLSAPALAQTGTYRAADALRLLPSVNNGITGDTASLGDDINLSIRGIGTLETTAALDGHPIGYGFPGGYNYQLSPIMGLRAIDVTYGSGGDLLGVNAIGGVVNFLTINPTRDPQLTFQQGYGTFSKLATNVQYTGTAGKLGYAVDYGVATLDGPFKNAYFAQPGSAFDPSAPVGSTAYPLYKDDSTAISRVGLVKLRYDLTPTSRITLTSTNSSYWEDKTGNGDGDYLDYPAALAFGNLLLKNKASGDPCGAGLFQPLNQFGVPAGTGQNGLPDGGVPCQTPQQYAHFNTGFDGAGPAWQSFNFNDEHVVYENQVTANQTVRFDTFTNRLLNTNDRTFQLPYQSVPGDQASWRNYGVAETGFIASDDFASRNNGFGLGATYLNSAYGFFKDGDPKGDPVVHDTSFFIRDAYRPNGSPLSLQANAYFKQSSETNTSYVDPRLSAAYELGNNNVVRVAAGATSTQPAGNEIDVPFVESPLGGAGGGKPINCSSTNSLGSAPSSILQPERGVDEEFSFGHRFYGDSQVQLDLYNTEVYDKLYSTLVPLSQSGTGFINPAYLSAQAEKLIAACGVSEQQAISLLGVSGTVNVGQLQSRGFDLHGRERLDRRTFIDYDWDLDSTILKSAPIPLLQANPDLIVNGQLPSLPLHTLAASVDHNFGRGIEARYTIHTVSVNNTKSLPAYNFSDFTISSPVPSGSFSLSISNLFSQYADIRGLRYEGVPLPLNQYASAADYDPYTGVAATERFGLPYRMIFLNYTFQTR
jgi:hypothetical protein